MDTRVKFTKAISKLPFIQDLSPKEQGRIYAKFTNLVYLNLEDIEMTAKDYKEKHGISKREIAKHYFKKDGLLDLEQIETQLSAIINFNKPDSEPELEAMFEQFFVSLSE